jgi:hypothetical protein
MNKTITLHQELHTQQLWALLKDRWRAMADAGKPLAVSVTAAGGKRSTDQNRRYWALVTTIARQAKIDGRQFGKDAWHEHLARRFGVCREMTLPDGASIMVRKSTADMDMQTFAAYLSRIEAYAVRELGIELLA